MVIDFHTYPVMIKELFESDAGLVQSIHDVFGFFFPPQPLESFLLEMNEAGVEQAVLLPTDCTTAHGCRIATNEQVAWLAESQARFIGFASVDPNLPDAPRQVQSAVETLGLKGLNLDPALQCFYPNDPRTVYPVFQACSDLRIPVIMQCGMNWAPRTLAKFAQPLLLEEAIQSFPDVNFVIAHCGWPWVMEAVMLAIKYPNAYLDTAILYSGTPKDALHQVLAGQVGLNVVERSLYNKILFGSDYPRVDIRRSIRGLRALGLSPTTENALLGKNAYQLIR